MRNVKGGKESSSAVSTINSAEDNLRSNQQKIYCSKERFPRSHTSEESNQIRTPQFSAFLISTIENSRATDEEIYDRVRQYRNGPLDLKMVLNAIKIAVQEAMDPHSYMTYNGRNPSHECYLKLKEFKPDLTEKDIEDYIRFVFKTGKAQEDRWGDFMITNVIDINGNGDRIKLAIKFWALNDPRKAPKIKLVYIPFKDSQKLEISHRVQVPREDKWYAKIIDNLQTYFGVHLNVDEVNILVESILRHSACLNDDNSKNASKNHFEELRTIYSQLTYEEFKNLIERTLAFGRFDKDPSSPNRGMFVLRKGWVKFGCCLLKLSENHWEGKEYFEGSLFWLHQNLSQEEKDGTSRIHRPPRHT